MLRDVQTYIAQNRTVSVADLTRHFRTNSDVLLPMLSKLSRKGRIRKLPIAAKCCHCTACDRDSLQLYEWLGDASSRGRLSCPEARDKVSPPSNVFSVRE